MRIVIRAASKSDASLLARLNRDVQSLHADLEPTIFKKSPVEEELVSFFSAKLSSPESRIYVADVADQGVGYVWFDIQVRPETLFTFPRSRVYVHHLSVREDARRQGVASMLLKHVEQQALALSIKDIALDAWTANDSALTFFSAPGFAPFNVSLRRQLS